VNGGILFKVLYKFSPRETFKIGNHLVGATADVRTNINNAPWGWLSILLSRVLLLTDLVGLRHFVWVVEFAAECLRILPLP